MSDKIKIKITNTSAIVQSPGHILSFHGVPIKPGRYQNFSVDVMEEVLDRWSRDGLAKVEEVKGNVEIPVYTAQKNEVVTAGTRIKEVSAETFDFEDDVSFDPKTAVEAQLPRENDTRGFFPDTRQEQGRAKVSSLSVGTEVVNEKNIEKAVELGNASSFTVRAPHNAGLTRGGVIKS